MGVTRTEFGIEKNTGKTIYQYTIENKNGLKAQMINYGAILTGLWVPDRNGELADVVLGHDSMDLYYENQGFLGATIGPSANRIGGAGFVIDGQTYHIPENEGPNNLHSDNIQGYHKRVYEVEKRENSVCFYITDEDGCMGFPGNKQFSVTYTLNDDNELRLSYQATSDKKTIFNPTNHSYFNLSGQGSGSILDHILWLKASYTTTAGLGLIPTGEIASVENTPMDFRIAKPIGRDIDMDTEQLKLGGGYDHNYCIDEFDGQLQKVAQVQDTKSGRIMEVFTTLPGIQFYAGNFLGDQEGKAGMYYHDRTGFALETQYYPDSANKENFPNAVFGPDREYVSTTVYKFCQTNL